VGVGEGAGGVAVAGLETDLGIGLEDEQPMVGSRDKELEIRMFEWVWTV